VRYSDTVRYVSGERSGAPAECTFLFTDLVGFTALTDADGDERAADVALEFHDRVRRLLPQHHAEEVKTIGDAQMLRCSNAGAAIVLGLRIVRELESIPGFPAVRVGVHTGNAVSRGGDWYGGTVNVAARLCSAAAGGEVLISEQTQRAAGRVRKVELGDRRLHWLKNVTEPVEAMVAREACPFGIRWTRRFKERLPPVPGSTEVRAA
jgi:adenylate cyclase